VAIVLDDAERESLTALTCHHGAPQSLAFRARDVLAAANGLTDKEIAARLDICAHWPLDIVFDEDDARTRKNHAPQNLSFIRLIALDILNAHPDKRSLARAVEPADIADRRQDSGGHREIDDGDRSGESLQVNG
jgi:hypothetical protein